MNMLPSHRKVLETLNPETCLGELPAYEVARRCDMTTDGATKALEDLVTVGVLTVDRHHNGLSYYSADSAAEVAELLSDEPRVWYKNDRLNSMVEPTQPLDSGSFPKMQTLTEQNMQMVIDALCRDKEDTQRTAAQFQAAWEETILAGLAQLVSASINDELLTQLANRFQEPDERKTVGRLRDALRDVRKHARALRDALTYEGETHEDE